MKRQEIAISVFLGVHGFNSRGTTDEEIGDRTNSRGLQQIRTWIDC